MTNLSYSLKILQWLKKYLTIAEYGEPIDVKSTVQLMALDLTTISPEPNQWWHSLLTCMLRQSSVCTPHVLHVLAQNWKWRVKCITYIVRKFSKSTISTCRKYNRLLHALGVIRGIWNRLWIFCGHYTFGVLDLHPRGIRHSVYDQSKIKMLPPMYTNNLLIIFCNA